MIISFDQPFLCRLWGRGMGCDSELLSTQTSGLACSVPVAHPGSSHTALTHAWPTAPDLQVSAAQAGGRAGRGRLGSLVRPPTQDARTSLVGSFRSLSPSSAFPVNHAAAAQPLPDHHFPFEWQLLPPTPGSSPIPAGGGGEGGAPAWAVSFPPQQTLIFSSPDRSAWQWQGCV